MSGKTAYLENAVLKLIFNAVAIPNLADNAASAPLTSFYIRLHTADPTDTPATEQTTSETSYGGYAGGIQLLRTSAGWAVSGSSVSPVSPVTYPICTSGTSMITHVSIGTLATGTGKMLFSGALVPPISIATGVIPTLTTASTITES